MQKIRPWPVTNAPYLSELPHAFCGFAATLMRDRLFVHRAMIDDSRCQSEHAQASSWLTGTYRHGAFSFETRLPGSPELPGNFLWLDPLAAAIGFIRTAAAAAVIERANQYAQDVTY